jgi:membrane-bound lytic murein transglycosylase D
MSNKNLIFITLNIAMLLAIVMLLVSCSSSTTKQQAPKPKNITKIAKPKIPVLAMFDINESYKYNYLFVKQKTRTYKYAKQYKKKFDDAHMIVPTIINQIEKKNLPQSLLFLVMVESGFTIRAKSKKKAMGLWQLMPNTAKHYKLEINTYLDERMDIHKSSEVALKHLMGLHNRFDKWYLAIMAYNGGETRIMEGITRAILDKHCKISKQCRANNKQILKYRKIIEGYQKKYVSFKQLHKVYKASKKLGYEIGIKDLLVVQKNMKRQYMPRESANYLRRIIALAYLNDDFEILNNKHKINVKIKEVAIKGGVSLKSVAKIINTDESELLKINHQIKRGITSPTKNQTNIYIPHNKLATYYENIDDLPAIKYIIYKVKKGDNLISIAKYYSLPYKLIKTTNNMITSRLRINQELLIPLDEDTYFPPKTHIVTSGDNLLYIAQKYNTRVSKLKKYNKLKNSQIFIGDKLIVNFNQIN